MRFYYPHGSFCQVISASRSSSSRKETSSDSIPAPTPTSKTNAIPSTNPLIMDDESLRVFGVFRESENDDIDLLVRNFTAPALGRALRDRESILQNAAVLASSERYEELSALLTPFLESNVHLRRKRQHRLDLSAGFSRQQLVIIQRYLHRIPRQVFQRSEKRASVVIPLCNVNGVASVLFEQRSSTVRTYKKQVCFPGGMLDEGKSCCTPFLLSPTPCRDSPLCLKCTLLNDRNGQHHRANITTGDGGGVRHTERTSRSTRCAIGGIGGFKY